MQFLSNLWDKVALFAQGWKVHLTAFALVFVNLYDSIVNVLDLSQFGIEPKLLTCINVALAMLVFVFRQMANTTQKLENVVTSDESAQVTPSA